MNSAVFSNTICDSIHPTHTEKAQTCFDFPLIRSPIKRASYSPSSKIALAPTIVFSLLALATAFIVGNIYGAVIAFSPSLRLNIAIAVLVGFTLAGTVRLFAWLGHIRDWSLLITLAILVGGAAYYGDCHGSYLCVNNREAMRLGLPWKCEFVAPQTLIGWGQKLFADGWSTNQLISVKGYSLLLCMTANLILLQAVAVLGCLNVCGKSCYCEPCKDWMNVRELTSLQASPNDSCFSGIRNGYLHALLRVKPFAQGSVPIRVLLHYCSCDSHSRFVEFKTKKVVTHAGQQSIEDHSLTGPISIEIEEEQELEHLLFTILADQQEFGDLAC